MAETTPTRTRTRSPAYPTCSLSEAIEKASVVWQKVSKHPAAVETVVTFWDYKPKSSGGYSTLSALKQFGLLSEEEGTSDRSVRLTDRAIRLVYNPDTASEDYQNLLKECALLPKLYTELWGKYEGNLPDDSVIERYLVVDRHFNREYVKSFIKDFRSTIVLAKLGVDDTVEGVGTEEPLKGDGRKQPPLVKPPFNPLADKEKQPLEFTIPLGGNKATLIFTDEPQDADFEDLISYVTLFKRQFKRKADKTESVKSKMSFPAKATWKNKEFDKPVIITGEMGERDGKTYFQSSDGTGIPETELTFDKIK